MSTPSPIETQLPDPARIAVVLLAGGSGSRMQGAAKDKVLWELGGMPLFRHSLETFIGSGSIGHFALVYRDAAQVRAMQDAIADLSFQPIWVPGGAERRDSVWAGLQALPRSTEVALIHDAARPFVSRSSVRASIAAALACGAACVARPVHDTVKTVVAGGGYFIPRTLDRASLWAMETPQVFRYPLIRDAYQRVIDSGRAITDDLSAIEPDALPVAFVDNGRPNPKLTTPEDLLYMEYLLAHEGGTGLSPVQGRDGRSL